MPHLQLARLRERSELPLPLLFLEVIILYAFLKKGYMYDFIFVAQVMELKIIRLHLIARLVDPIVQILKVCSI